MTVPVTKIVIVVHPNDMSLQELARFTLQPDGKVVAQYRSASFRNEMRFGIWKTKVGRLRPSDGPPFFDALDTAYANSSFMYVTSDE